MRTIPFIRSVSLWDRPFLSSAQLSSHAVGLKCSALHKPKGRPCSTLKTVAFQLPFSESQNRFPFPSIEQTTPILPHQKVIMTLVELNKRKALITNTGELKKINHQMRMLWVELQNKSPIMIKEDGAKALQYKPEETHSRAYQKEMNELLIMTRLLNNHKQQLVHIDDKIQLIQEAKSSKARNRKAHKATKQSLEFVLARIGLANANKISTLENDGSVKEIIFHLTKQPAYDRIIKQSRSLSRQFHTAIKNANRIQLEKESNAEIMGKMESILLKIEGLDKRRSNYFSTKIFHDELSKIDAIQSDLDMFLESTKRRIFSVQTNDSSSSTMELLCRFTQIPEVSKVVQRREDLGLMVNTIVKLIVDQS